MKFLQRLSCTAAAVLFGTVCTADTKEQITSKVVQSMQKGHFSTPKLNDATSQKLFNAYFKALDPGKMYFLEEDIKEFGKYKLYLDDMLKKDNCAFAFAVNRRLEKRAFERVEYVKEALKKKFDFTLQESLSIDFNKAQYSTSQKEQDERWRRIVKNEKLTRILAAENTQGGLKNPLTDEERILKKYYSFANLVKGRDATAVLEIYLSSFTKLFDPHSVYMSERQFESFQSAMNLSLHGIGATLEIENGYCRINSIVTGGPAHRQGDLKANDLILAVAQGESGEFVDVINTPIMKVVELIRGSIGSKVKLSVATSEGAAPREIIIERAKIRLEDSAARGEIKDFTKDGLKQRIAYIYLPGFYSHCARDVRSLIEGFRKDGKIDGLIFDLRGNGGGDLKQTVLLCSMFIKEGPMVLLKTTQPGTRGLYDVSKNFQYEMPMLVMVDHNSASASEIFSGVMQDYSRAVIIGDSNTHGKGTMQNVTQFRPRSAKLGGIKLTTGKFYLPSGRSTQEIGVIGDITMPSFLDSIAKGEASLENALKWDEIPSGKFTKDKKPVSIHIPLLKKNSEKRLLENAGYKKRLLNIKKHAQHANAKRLSLNKEERRSFQKLSADLSSLATGVIFAHSRNKLSKEIQGDITDYRLIESFNILKDLIELQK